MRLLGYDPATATAADAVQVKDMPVSDAQAAAFEPKTEYKDASFTAVVGRSYNANEIGTPLIVTSPAGTEGASFNVFVQGGTVNVGGVDYTDGQTIKAHYVGGGWEYNLISAESTVGTALVTAASASAARNAIGAASEDSALYRIPDSGIAPVLEARATPLQTTDIPAITFTGPGGSTPISGAVNYAYNTASVTRLGAYPVTVNQFSVDYQQNQVNGSSGSGAPPWAVEFDTRSTDIVLRFRAATATVRIWTWVDDRPVTLIPPAQTGNVSAGSLSFMRVRFADSKTRRIRFYMIGADFGGIDVATSYNIVANPKAELKKVAFVGDSWGNSSATNVEPFTLPFMLGRLLGVEMAHCSINGTGYVAGTNFENAARMTGLTAYAPDYIFVQGSINDTASHASVQAAATSYYGAVATALPSAKLIVVGPQPVPSGYNSVANQLANNAAVKAAALAASNVIAYIDPMEGEWLNGTTNITSAFTRGARNGASLVTADNLHLVNAGGAYYAQRIAEEAIRALENEGDFSVGLLANTTVPTAPARVDALGNTTITGTLSISGNVLNNLSVTPASGFALVNTTAPSTSNASAYGSVPAGTLSGSNPLWYIGHRHSAQGPFSLWRWNGGAHEANSLSVSTAGVLTTLSNVISGGVVRTNGYTVATLPAGTLGDIAYVTDATTPTYLGALTGGGAVRCPVFYNGTAWVSA